MCFMYACLCILHPLGQLYWSKNMVSAAAEWTERGSRLRDIHKDVGSQALLHELNIMSYVDDQVRICLHYHCCPYPFCSHHSYSQHQSLNTFLFYCVQLDVAFTLMCVELKSDILAIIANCRVDSQRIRVGCMLRCSVTYVMLYHCLMFV